MKNAAPLGFDFNADDGWADRPHDPLVRGCRFFVKDREVAIGCLNNRFQVMLNQSVRLKLFGRTGCSPASSSSTCCCSPNPESMMFRCASGG